MTKKMRNWCLAVAVILPACITGFAFCQWAIGVDTDTPTSEEIEEYGKLKLPHSATNIRANLDGCCGEFSLWVRFDMDVSEESSFWATTLCNASPTIGSPLPSGSKLHDLEIPVRVWWKPEFKSGFTARELDEKLVYQGVLINHLSNSREEVYLRLYYQ